VGFPAPTSDQTTNNKNQKANNDNVASVIVASRPFGATPLAGMFTGAQYFFQSDPSGPGASGTGDPLVLGGCRPEYIILLTDGAPNYDMRPDCAATSSGDAGGTAGVCPFKLPEDIAGSLYNGGVRAGTQQFVTTYVIGFAVSSFFDAGTLVGCSSLVSNGAFTASATAKCASTDPATVAAYGPCCELQRVAIQGGTQQAYFADTPGDLQNALGSILAKIAKNATTRTAPAYSAIVTNGIANTTTPQTNASAYLASFNPSPGLPWSGNVQRQRYDCTYSVDMSGKGSFTVPPPAVDPAKGDDFAANLNTAAAPTQRVYIAMQPDAVTGKTIDSTVTIRPYVTATVGDGLGKYGATTYVGTPTAVVPNISPDALNITISGPNTGCQYTPNNAPGPKYLGASDSGASCRNMLLDFTFGQSFSGPADFTFVSRTANAFGDVFHATPAVVGPPGALLQDPSYVGFRATWNALTTASGAKARDQIVYVATNDGLLHAFWADETKLENNERWAMLLPAAMPSLQAAYPSSHQFLLDGSPIVKDVIWERSSVTDPSVWHTMLVAGFGPSAQGYYAVDVTNPDPSGLPSGASPPVADPDSTGKPPGPVFRWQLTTMPSTNYPIFGSHSGTPAITTLFMNPDNTANREIGVAILPGGVDKAGSSSVKCQRQSDILSTTGAQPLDTNFAYRKYVRCWGANNKQDDVVNGRSLTIVRVDTGEILHVFARDKDVPLTDTLRKSTPSRFTDTPLDSPMTGTPMVYPNEVGTNATKVFVGDADGTIWRFDLSNPDPSQWVGEIYLDLYNNTADPPSPDNSFDGQPFDVPPVMSVSPAGEVVLNVATGAIESFDNNGSYYVYSITEKVQGSAASGITPKLRASVNWWLGPNSTPVALRQGERVSGPMTVFNRTLYFATYYAGDPKAVVCNNGSARLWGFDYVTPYGTACASSSASCGQGGVRRLQAPADFVDPVVTNGAPQGAVVPGVSIKMTPACASLGTAAADNYTGAMHAAPTNFAAGTYSLFAQIGAKAGSGSATQQVDITLAPPASPTLIDSWAAVLE
jgi:type IV pilus assembly protein PilY1